MFTIVIPLYNKIRSIAATIESVLNQTNADFELIIINDGSTDGSERIVSNYDDNRIRLISRENRGLCATRNEGIERATNDFVTLLDADDVLDVTFLEKMKQLMDGFPNCDVYCSSYDVEKRGKILKRKLHLPFEHSGIIEDYYDCQLKNTEILVWTCVAVVRKQAFKRAGMYDIGLTRAEDFDMWYRIFPEGKLAYLNEPLAIYGDSDPMRVTVETVINPDPKRDLLFNLDKLKEREDKYPQLKKLLDLCRLQFLRPYYLEGKNDLEVNAILEVVDSQSYSLFATLFYKVLPRELLRPAYRLFKNVKKLVA